MQDCFDFLNKNSGAITALASILMIFVTISYVVINSKMHNEMKNSRLKSEEPEIAIRLVKVISGFYNLEIENISNNTAYNITFEEYPKMGDICINDNETPGFLKDGIKYMAPAQKYRSFFINYPEICKKYLNELPEIQFKMKFSNSLSKVFEKTIKINLSLIYNNRQLDNGTEIHEHLRSINNNFYELIKRVDKILENKK